MLPSFLSLHTERCVGFCSATRGFVAGLLLLSDMKTPDPVGSWVGENATRVLEEGYRRSSLRLQTQEQIALAADQRGLVGAGLAFATAGVGYPDSPLTSVWQMLYLTLFVVSGLLFLRSAVPGLTYTAGSPASDLDEALKRDTSLNDLIAALNEENDRCIRCNEKAQVMRTKWFKVGLVAFVLGGTFLLVQPSLDLLRYWKIL